MDHPVLTAYITLPSPAVGESIAQKLLEQKLIACANIFSPHQSIYSWENQIKSETEYAMIIKSQLSHKKALTQLIQELHPYETPCILFSRVDSTPDFFNWVIAETIP
jgi:periplasmic divalent cation tolerance protein